MENFLKFNTKESYEKNWLKNILSEIAGKVFLKNGEDNEYLTKQTIKYIMQLGIAPYITKKHIFQIIICMCLASSDKIDEIPEIWKERTIKSFLTNEFGEGNTEFSSWNSKIEKIRDYLVKFFNISVNKTKVEDESPNDDIIFDNIMKDKTTNIFTISDFEFMDTYLQKVKEIGLDTKTIENIKIYIYDAKIYDQFEFGGVNRGDEIFIPDNQLKNNTIEHEVTHLIGTLTFGFNGFLFRSVEEGVTDGFTTNPYAYPQEIELIDIITKDLELDKKFFLKMKQDPSLIINFSNKCLQVYGPLIFLKIIYCIPYSLWSKESIFFTTNHVIKSINQLKNRK